MRAVVVLAGPDGAGKTTLAQALIERRPDAVRVHGHRRSTGAATPNSDPHAKNPYGRAASLAKLTYLFVRHLLARRPDGLVIVERHFLDIAVDPRRYRIALPAWLPRAFARLLPRPSLGVLLDVPAAVAHERKAELGARELQRQCELWRRIAGERGWLVLDATRPTEELCDALLARVDHGSLTRRLLGSEAASGPRHRLVMRRGEPRFLLPARRGPWRAGVYRPAGARQVLPALALELALPGRRLRLDPAAGAAPAIAAAIGLPRVELSAATLRKAGGERALLAVRSPDGRLVAFAKAGDVNAGGLEREHAVLTALTAAAPVSFTVPEPLALIDWEETKILVVAPVPTRGRAGRPLGVPELSALVELAGLGDTLEPALGRADGLVPVHGDFAAWNSARTAGRLVLWDWEEARLGLPLEDYFHWRTVEAVSFGRGGAVELVAAASQPAAEIRELSRRLGLDEDAPRIALRAYLERGLADPRLKGKREPALPVRRQALELLEVT